MTPTNSNDELLQKLNALLAQTAAPQPTAPSPFGFPPAPVAFPTAPTFAQPATQPAALFVAVNIETPNGNAPCYVQLPPSALANPVAAIQQLAAAGWPIRFYQPRPTGGNFGGGGGGWQQGRKPWGTRSW